MSYESLKDSIYSYLLQSYRILEKKFDLHPKYRLRFESDQYSDQVGYLLTTTCETPLMNFNLYKINNEFKKATRLISVHEMCHLFCDEMYDKWNLYDNESSNNKHQDPFANKGHPRLFFELMYLFKFNEDELEVQRKRHEIPYHYGFDDTYSMEDYDMIKRLIKQSVNLRGYIKEYKGEKITNVKSLCRVITGTRLDFDLIEKLKSEMSGSNLEKLLSEVNHISCIKSEDENENRIINGAKFIKEVLSR